MRSHARLFRAVALLSVPSFVLLITVLPEGGSREVAAAEKDRAGTARQILEDAYAGRHYYGKGFPGFEARLTCVFGNEKTRGKVKVLPSGEVEVEIPQLATRQWVHEQLSIMVSHRLRKPRHDPRSLTLEDDDGHPMGARIRIKDEFETSFRIKDHRVREVHRSGPGFRFAVSVLDYTKAADAKDLPRHLAVSYFDSVTGRLLRTFVFQDAYRQLEKYALPERRLAVGHSDQGVHTVYFDLSEHKLLEKTTDL